VAERWLRSGGALSALAVVAVVVTGCAGIPVQSSVEAATPVAGDGRTDVRIEAQPPQTGATPTQIVEGFLDAMSSYQLGFPLAEEFLTPDARDGWDRDAIEVYNRTTLEEIQPGLVELVGDPAARIDGSGRFSPVEPASPPLTHSFRLAQVEVDGRGEWRIANPPNFLLISSFDLSRTYSPFLTYFPDPAGQVLVPDRVWLPAGEPQLATLLAQALVDGPTDLIDGGVANPFPLETVVSGGAISGGRAVVTVALPVSSIGEIDGAARRLMVAQLADTMTQLPAVEVVLTMGGQVIDVPDDSGELAALAGFEDPPAYVLAEDSAVRLADPTRVSNPVPVAGPLGRGEVPSRSLAVALDRTVAATVDETGTQVLRTALTDDGAPVRVYQGQDVGALSFDRYGNLWLVDRRGADGRTPEVKLVQPDGAVVPVAAPGLAGLRVTDLRLAPDGVRIAVVTDGPVGGLQLGHVIRGAVPEIALTVDLPFDGTVTDVAWAGPTDLLVVATPVGGLARPYSVTIDGATVTEGSVTGITAVAAYANRLAFALTDANNVLQQTSVLQWDPVTTGRSVTYPG
jgi:hypothetical protein